MERVVPADPMAFIRKCIEKRRVFWTYHINMRMEKRAIARAAVLESSASFEVIEAYPEDKYLPSYLVYFRHEDIIHHVLIATDVPGGNIRIVTVYRPNPEQWSADLKRRKRT